MKEIKFKDLNAVLGLIIIFSFFLSLLGYGFVLYHGNTIVNLKENIKDVPHVVCVNKTIYGRTLSINDTFRPLELSAYEILYYDCMSMASLEKEAWICREVLEIKEVCKLVDAEGNEIK